MKFSRGRILEWVPFPFSESLPNPGGWTQLSRITQMDSLPAEPQKQQTWTALLKTIKGNFSTASDVCVISFLYLLYLNKTPLLKSSKWSSTVSLQIEISPLEVMVLTAYMAASSNFH